MIDIGVDVVEVQRFRELNYRKHKDFYDRIFTPEEIEYCLLFKQPEQHFAATFAGKEAVYKAIGRYTRIKVSDIEIFREKSTPKVRLIGNASLKFKKPPEIKVSLSHTYSCALAFALVVFELNGLENEVSS